MAVVCRPVPSLATLIAERVRPQPPMEPPVQPWREAKEVNEVPSRVWRSDLDIRQIVLQRSTRPGIGPQQVPQSMLSTAPRTHYVIEVPLESLCLLV